MALREEVENFGNFPCYYMGLVTADGGLEQYDGTLTNNGQNGKIAAECVDPTSMANLSVKLLNRGLIMKFPYFKSVGYPDGAYRVGPLARLNVASHCDTPLAEQELKEFKKLGKNGVVQSTFHYHYARLMECCSALKPQRNFLRPRNPL